MLFSIFLDLTPLVVSGLLVVGGLSSINVVQLDGIEVEDNYNQHKDLPQRLLTHI